MVDHVLEAALSQHQVVTIIYQKDNCFSKRNIRILGIKGDNIEAYCFLRHQIRHFKKDNILAAELFTQ